MQIAKDIQTDTADGEFNAKSSAFRLSHHQKSSSRAWCHLYAKSQSPMSQRTGRNFNGTFIPNPFRMSHWLQTGIHLFNQEMNQDSLPPRFSLPKRKRSWLLPPCVSTPKCPRPLKSESPGPESHPHLKSIQPASLWGHHRGVKLGKSRRLPSTKVRAQRTRR